MEIERLPVIRLTRGENVDMRFTASVDGQLVLSPTAVVTSVMRKGKDPLSSLAESQFTGRNIQTPRKQISLTMTPEESAMLEQDTYWFTLTLTDGPNNVEKYPLTQLNVEESF